MPESIETRSELAAGTRRIAGCPLEWAAMVAGIVVLIAEANCALVFLKATGRTMQRSRLLCCSPMEASSSEVAGSSTVVGSSVEASMIVQVCQHKMVVNIHTAKSVEQETFRSPV